MALRAAYIAVVTLPHSRFLVVDDGDEDVFILTQLLDRAGVTERILCRTAESAIEWLVSLNGNIPLAAFVDVRLPARSGFEVLKAIRESEKLRSMVVMLLSASDEPRNLGKAVQLGADGYMVKFPSISAMRDVVAAIHGRTVAEATGRVPLAVPGNLLLNAAAMGARPA